MAKNKKSVSIGVFHILKSVMDAKAKPLNRLVDLGRRATQEEPLLNDQINRLYEYSAYNYYDRSSVRDAEDAIAEYESQIYAVRERIKRGEQAQKDLEHVAQFNNTYDVIVNGNPVAKMQDEYRIIEDRISKLDERIFACQVNMRADERDAETVAQAEHDIEYYQTEYEDLVAKREALGKQIARLQKQK